MGEVSVHVQRAEEFMRTLTAVVFGLVALLLCGAASCQRVVEDSSAAALESGDRTLLLGADCMQPLSLGYSACQLKKGQPIPELKIYFMNPAEYAVSDCQFNILKTGSTNEAGEVTVDLTNLQDQVSKNGFCMLRVEAIERYVDPSGSRAIRQIAFAGGFFIEMLEPSYFPEPSDAAVSWCYKIKGTNRGRRKMEKC